MFFKIKYKAPIGNKYSLGNLIQRELYLGNCNNVCLDILLQNVQILKYNGNKNKAKLNGLFIWLVPSAAWGPKANLINISFDPILELSLSVTGCPHLYLETLIGLFTSSMEGCKIVRLQEDI